MQAGLLKEWITVEGYSETRDAYGGQEYAWRTLWRTRARIRQDKGDRVLELGETTHTVTYTVTVRYRPGLTREMRLGWGGEHYRILAVDRNRREMSHVIRCELINE